MHALVVDDGWLVPLDPEAETGETIELEVNGGTVMVLVQSVEFQERPVPNPIGAEWLIRGERVTYVEPFITDGPEVPPGATQGTWCAYCSTWIECTQEEYFAAGAPGPLCETHAGLGNRCVCCDNEVEPRNHDDPWEGRLDGFCYHCASIRCDAYPGECKRVPDISNRTSLEDELAELERTDPKVRAARENYDRTVQRILERRPEIPICGRLLAAAEALRQDHPSAADLCLEAAERIEELEG